MKYFIGIVTVLVLTTLIFTGLYAYQELSSPTTPQSSQETNDSPTYIDDVETSTPTYNESYNDEDTSSQTLHSSDSPTPNNDVNTYTPSLEEQQENYTKHINEHSNETSQDWKEEYDSINQGTDEIPYVMIDGVAVDPKHVTGKEVQ